MWVGHVFASKDYVAASRARVKLIYFQPMEEMTKMGPTGSYFHEHHYMVKNGNVVKWVPERYTRWRCNIYTFHRKYCKGWWCLQKTVCL